MPPRPFGRAHRQLILAVRRKIAVQVLKIFSATLVVAFFLVLPTCAQSGDRRIVFSGFSPEEKEILAGADSRIEKYRMATARLSFTTPDPDGRPLASAKVRIEQTEHEFLFGVNRGYIMPVRMFSGTIRIC